MVGAFTTHHRKFMCGCNNSICQRISNQTWADYTLEAVLWTSKAALGATSLTKIEGERPGTFDSEKLFAVDQLLRILL